MSSRSINRKDFLVITVSAVTASVLAAACGGDDPPAPGGTAGTTGTGGSGTAGTGTAGTGTAGTGTAGTGTAGTGTAGTASGGTASGGTASGGASGSGSGGMSGGGGSGGRGGAGGSGGSSGGSGGSGGGGGGGMCGTASIMQTSTEMHDHIPADPAMLKMSLKTLINGTAASMASMEFTLPSDGQGGGHVHKIKLSAQQVTMLKGGGMVTGLVTYDTMEGEATHATGHTHTYTISCVN
jgi:hypothetical protein